MPSKPTTVELDFLGLDRDNTAINTSPTSSAASSKSQLRRLYDRQRSFKEVQNAITKIDPELLKATMPGLCPVQDSITGNFNGPKRSISVPSSPKSVQTPAPSAAPPPLTIFYNGKVSVFKLHQDKAETILKFVEEGWFKKPPASEEHKLSTSSKDWMMAHTTRRRMLQRNVSLQRFLEKRKERLTAMHMHNNVDGIQKKNGRRS